MNNKFNNQNVLFFTRTMGDGGTENIVVSLCEILKPLVNKIIVCASYGCNVEKLVKLGVKFYDIKDIENKNPINFIKNSIRIREIVKNENVTIIHTHHRMAAFYVTFNRLYNKCKFINTSHTVFSDKLFLTKYSLKHALKIACGNNVRNNLVDFFCIDSAEVISIPNGIKSYNESVILDEDIDKYRNYFKIGIIGRIDKLKGIDCFVESYKYLSVNNKRVVYFIIGDGEYKNTILEKINSFGFNNNILYLGKKDKIQNIISQLDLVVSCSLIEGLPLNIIESFSVKKAVVASDIPGNNEIVSDKYNGLLTKPQDAIDLANKISFLANNNNVLSEYNNNAYRTYLENYSFEVFSKKYIDCYDRVINNA